MKLILSVTLIVLVVHNSHAKEELFTTCPELKGSKFETFSKWLSLEKPYKGSKFYFGLKTENHGDGLLEINSKSMSALESAGFRIKDVFDVSLKTYVIIHGYRSTCKKPWVLEMKEKILKTENVNVILVDWSSGSYSWNYIDSVRTTTKVSNDLSKLLFNIKSKVLKSKSGSSSWNKLYFIGHSLGAHIAGQTGHLLKKEDDFFKIERITGLDPARPCFIEAKSSIKLDKTDADFVDIIHTQTSQGNKIFGLGLRDPIGHLDFYVNGGVMQPACKSDSVLMNELDDMFCSHRMSYQYFLESLNNTKSCRFEGHPWDQTYSNAVEILEKVKSKKPCDGCVEVGKNALNNVENFGTYLVFASAKAPYCSLKKGDISKIEEKLKLLNPPKGEKSLFSLLFDTRKKRQVTSY